MPGDTLARGGKSATFGPPKVSQEKWDEIFGEEEKLTAVIEQRLSSGKILRTCSRCHLNLAENPHNRKQEDCSHMRPR